MAKSPAWLKVKPPATRLILQGGSDLRLAAASSWGVSFPQDACRAVVREDRAILWLGPDEFLLWDASPNASQSGYALEQAIQPYAHSLVDVSHRQVALQISGPHAATILSGACPLDFDLEAFPVNMCTRTVFAKAEILLWRIAPDVFHLEVWRSFQPYVTELLAEIGLEFDAA
jgi:sarcosine oxidase, subunit gamma